MPYQTRTPSVKISIDVKLFNDLIERLTQNEQKEEELNNFSLNAKKLKEKILTYSVPRENEDGITIIDIRFFPNEASNIIIQLLSSNIPTDYQTDYYSVLLKIRESKKEANNN